MVRPLLRVLAEECQEDAERWFDLKGEEHLVHHVLALCGEAGELANLVKKIDRGTITFAEAKKALKDETTDIFVYLLNVAGILDMDLFEAYAKKREYNDKRFSKLGLGKGSK